MLVGKVVRLDVVAEGHRRILGGGEQGSHSPRNWPPASSRRGHLGPLECKKTFYRPGFHPGPRWGSLQRSTDSLAGREGASYPSLKPHPVLGPLGIAPDPK